MHKLFLLSLLFLLQLTNAVAQENTPEPLHVKFDKEFYLAGEDIWYSVFFLSPQTRQSEIVRTELWGPNGEKIISQQLKVEEGRSWGDIALPANLPNGYYIFRAYTLWNLNFTPKVLFNQAIPVFQPEIEDSPESPLTANSYQPQQVGGLRVSPIGVKFRPREKISFSIQGPATASTNIPLSIIVKDANYWGEGPTLLNAVEQSKELNFAFAPPAEGLILPEVTLRNTFSIRRPDNGKLVESPYVVGFVNQTGQRLVKPVTKGVVSFEFVDFYDSTQVQIFDASPYEATYTPVVSRISLEDALPPPTIDKDIPPKTPLVQNYIQEYQRRFQLEKLFGSLENIRARRNVVKAKRPTPTSSYEVDAYNPFGGMENFIKNAVPPLGVRTRKKKNAEGFFDPDNPTYDKSFKLYIPNDFTLTRNKRIRKPPLLQVNEFFTYDKEAVWALPWSNIARLDIYNRLLTLPDQFGPIGNFGVISFVTRDGKTPDEIANSPNNVVIPGYYAPRIFNLTDLSDLGPLDSKIPDFRPIFYWNPSVNISTEESIPFEFFASDKPGRYVIQMETVGADGKPILYEHVFSIGMDQ
ncbi:MAG: hypothetical protein AAGA10_25730 [Bacteroidota bacterium]